MMTNLNKILIVATLASSLGACVTQTASDGLAGDAVSVVERSKEQPPTWIEFEGGTLLDADGYMKLVETQTRILSLPLGVKQTQLAAIESHRRATGAKMKAVMNDRASTEGIDLTSASAELDRHIEAVIDGKHGEVARVRDIYFEKLANEKAAPGGQSEFYQVHVMVQMARGEFDTMSQQLARRLAQSGNPSLRRLGQALLLNPSLSH